MWYCFSYILIKIQVKLQLLVRFLIIVFLCKIVTKSKCYKYSSITRITASSSKWRKRCTYAKPIPLLPSQEQVHQFLHSVQRLHIDTDLDWEHTDSHCFHVPMASVSLLNFQSCRHIGHSWLTCWEFSHLTIQWIWKQCEHSPQTEKDIQHKDLRT